MDNRETEEQKEARYERTVQYLQTADWANDGGTVSVHMGPEFNYADLSEKRMVVVAMELPNEVADCVDEEQKQNCFSGIVEDMRQAAIRYANRKHSAYC